jgi:hypothetical protein
VRSVWIGAVTVTLLACGGPGPPTEKELRLAAAYPELYQRMEGFGCPRCHTTGTQEIANRFRLPPPGEDDIRAVRFLLHNLDWTTVAESRLVRKPSAQLRHRGGRVLSDPMRQVWIEAIETWMENARTTS